MGKFRITCKEHDTNDVIVKVGVEGEKDHLSVAEIIRRIEKENDSFYTMVNGNRAEVHVDDGKYISTNPDEVTENNLDELSSC